MSAAVPPNEMSFWARIQQDVAEIKHDMGLLATKAELAALAASKADAAVAEDRWKNIWQDVAEIRTELRQRPQQQTQNFFQAMGCSINALYLLVAAVSMLGTLAAVIVSIIALIHP